MSERGKSKKEALAIIDYIDGSLSSKRKESFELRLASSVKLSREVLNQKRIRAALRALPMKKAPRSFILSPDMVKLRKPKFRLAPAFSFASAGVTLLLLAVFAGEFLLGNRSQVALMESAAPEMTAYDETVPTEPLLIFWDAVPAGKGGGGEEAFGLGSGMAGPEIESAVLVPEYSEEPVAEEMILGSDPPTLQESVEEQETVIFGLNLDENETDQLKDLRRATLWQVMRSVSILQWMKIGLGIVALGFGITAFTLWIKQRH